MTKVQMELVNLHNIFEVCDTSADIVVGLEIIYHDFDLAISWIKEKIRSLQDEISVNKGNSICRRFKNLINKLKDSLSIIQDIRACSNCK